MTPWLIKLKEKLGFEANRLTKPGTQYWRGAQNENKRLQPHLDKLLKVEEAAERCQVAFGNQDSSDLGPARRDLFRALNELRESVE